MYEKMFMLYLCCVKCLPGIDNPCKVEATAVYGIFSFVAKVVIFLMHYFVYSA